MTPEEFQERYKMVAYIGPGRSGEVFKYQNKRTKQTVAVRQYVQANRSKRFNYLDDIFQHHKQRQQYKKMPEIVGVTQEINKKTKGLETYNINVLFQYIPSFLTIFAKHSEDQKKQKNLMAQEVINYAKCIIKTLFKFQKKSKAHGNLRPSNILIQDYVVYLMDILLFKPSIDLVHPYLAPEFLEQLKLEKSLFKPKSEESIMKADVWSLGLILLQLLTLQFDTKKQNRVDIKFLIDLLDSAVHKNVYPPDLYKLIQDMVNDNPKMRPTTRQVMRELMKCENRLLEGYETSSDDEQNKMLDKATIEKNKIWKKIKKIEKECLEQCNKQGQHIGQPYYWQSWQQLDQWQFWWYDFGNAYHGSLIEYQDKAKGWRCFECFYIYQKARGQINDLETEIELLIN